MSKKLTAVRQLNKPPADDDITFHDQVEETCSNTEIDNTTSFNHTTEAPAADKESMIVAT